MDYSRPHLTAEDVAAAGRVLASGQLDYGPLCRRLEETIAALMDVPARYVVVTNSGTAALDLATRRLDGGRMGLMCPVITWGSSHCLNEDALLVDVDADGWPVWPYVGYSSASPCPVEVALWGRTPRFSSPFVSVLDAAHDVFNPKHRRLLDSGEVRAVCYSFGPLKELCAGHGGALIMPMDQERRDRVRSWARSGCLPGFPVRLSRTGHNLLMREYNAAIALSQLQRWERMYSDRQLVLEMYRDALGSRLLTQPEAASGHLAVARFRDPDGVGVAERVGVELERHGIRTAVHYPLPAWCRDRDYPGAARLVSEILTLPCHLGLRSRDVYRVCRVLQAFWKREFPGNPLRT